LQDRAKAMELYGRAADLGYMKAHYNLAGIFLIGRLEERQVPLRGCCYGRTRTGTI
jgi:TPR repeat protein